MISIPNVMPITPHSGAKMLERPKHCWVIYPFNTEEDEFEEIKDFLTSLSEFFYQRSGVNFLYRLVLLKPITLDIHSKYMYVEP